MEGRLTVCDAQAVHCATAARGAAPPTPGAVRGLTRAMTAAEPGTPRAPLGRGPPHGDRPAVRLDQPFDDEQAEPGAAAPLGAPELAEDPRRELGGDAVALVADRNRSGGPAGRARSAQAARRTGSRIRTAGDGFDRLYHNRHRTSTVSDRVLDQIAEYLVHLV